MEEDAKRRLKSAELQAKKTRLRIWRNHIPPVSNQFMTKISQERLVTTPNEVMQNNVLSSHSLLSSIFIFTSRWLSL